MIEGDIKGYINHKKLEELLCRHIEDQQFIDLYWKAVRAGYVEMASGKSHYGIIGGVSQGGVLSPILSNIYLHEFDTFMTGKILLNDIPISLDHPEYKRIHTDISNARQAHQRAVKRGDTKFAEYKQWEKERHKYQAVQISYVRYADDFVIAVRGAEEKAAQINEEVKQYLESALHLELNQGKTQITDIKTGRAKFLGAEIRAFHSRTSDTKKTVGGYSSSGKTILLAPLEKLVKKLEEQGICRIENFALRKIIPTRKTA
jgi:retron-type reverse transcriptase